MDCIVGISINLAVVIKLPSWRGDQIIKLDSVCVDQSWQQLFKDRLGINEAFILKGRRHRVDEKLPIRIYYEQFRWQWNRYKITVLPAPIVPAKTSRVAIISKKRKTGTMAYQEGERNNDNNPPPKLFPISPLQDVKAPIVPVPAKKYRAANMSRKRKAETMAYQEDERNIDNNPPPNLLPKSTLQDVKRCLEFGTDHTRMMNDKVQVKNIRKFLSDRISDTDILKIRSELNDLKRRGNYIELIRIASFTAGLLESCFL